MPIDGLTGPKLVLRPEFSDRNFSSSEFCSILLGSAAAGRAHRPLLTPVGTGDSPVLQPPVGGEEDALVKRDP